MSVDSVKQKNISKTLTLWNFFTIGFGAIIGTGWIFLVGEWIIISGGPIPAMLAFLLGALLLLPIGAVFGELTSALPIDGGVIEYVDRTYGKTVSFITGWLLLLSNIIMCPWETIAVSTLLGTLLQHFRCRCIPFPSTDSALPFRIYHQTKSARPKSSS